MIQHQVTFLELAGLGLAGLLVFIGASVAVARVESLVQPPSQSRKRNRILIGLLARSASWAVPLGGGMIILGGASFAMSLTWWAAATVSGIAVLGLSSWGWMIARAIDRFQRTSQRRADHVRAPDGRNRAERVRNPATSAVLITSVWVVLASVLLTIAPPRVPMLTRVGVLTLVVVAFTGSLLVFSRHSVSRQSRVAQISSAAGLHVFSVSGLAVVALIGAGLTLFALIFAAVFMGVRNSLTWVLSGLVVFQVLVAIATFWRGRKPVPR